MAEPPSWVLAILARHYEIPPRVSMRSTKSAINLATSLLVSIWLRSSFPFSGRPMGAMRAALCHRELHERAGEITFGTYVFSCVRGFVNFIFSFFYLSHKCQTSDWFSGQSFGVLCIRYILIISYRRCPKIFTIHRNSFQKKKTWKFIFRKSSAAQNYTFLWEAAKFFLLTNKLDTKALITKACQKEI